MNKQKKETYFDIGVIEVLSKTLEIKAIDSEQAIERAKEKYDSGEVVLDSSDFDNMPVFQDINKQNVCFNCSDTGGNPLKNNRFTRSFEEVISYLIADERKHWEECGEPKEHIYNHVMVLAEWLKNNR